MVSDAKFVLLDLFWDRERNGGTIEDIDPIVDDVSYYWWKCYGCGKSYLSSTRRVLLDFKNNKYSPLNNYCIHCKSKGVPLKYSMNSILDYIHSDYKEEINSLLKKFLLKGSSSYTFYVFCPDCNEFHWANESTFSSRGSFCCKKCASLRKAVKSHGSVDRLMPEILPYYSSKNKLPARKVPVWRVNCDDNRLYLICPDCGIEHSKRMDAIISNGAYCGPCANHKNTSNNGNSLYNLYPEVAKMFDAGGNSVSSSEVSPGSNRVYNFMCDNGGIPHIFTKKISAMVSANKRGGLGCPVCKGFEIQEGVNDFKSRNPEMAKFWDYDMNSVKPEEVYYKSRDKYYFKCKEGHSFLKDPFHAMRSVGTSTLGCPVCHGKVILKGVNDLATLRPDLLKYWDYSKNTLSPDEVTIYSNKEAWFRCANESCGNIYLSHIDTRVLTSGFCEDCRKRQWSFAEKELVGIVRDWGLKVEEESRFLGGLNSFDIYLPEKNIAIDYNGLYWHSDRVRSSPDYHYNKYMMCKEVGVDLLYVWEDDYMYKKEVVLNMLKVKLGIGEERKVNARDCDFSIVSYQEAREFLENNHIQGSASGSVYLSLVEIKTGNVVALAVLQDIEDNSVLLKRYCTNCNVRGGFSKIVSYIESSGIYEGIVTFSDNGVSNGSLYKNNGFVKVAVIDPDYSYVVDHKRRHKFNYRIERFKKDQDLLYQEGLTERELALLNDIPRVWDAGKVKWYRKFNV